MVVKIRPFLIFSQDIWPAGGGGDSWRDEAGSSCIVSAVRHSGDFFYVFVFVYVYLCICICIFVFVYLFLFLSLGIFVLMYFCICICAFVQVASFQLSVTWVSHWSSFPLHNLRSTFALQGDSKS